jgi:hypothetical protein
MVCKVLYRNPSYNGAFSALLYTELMTETFHRLGKQIEFEYYPVYGDDLEFQVDFWRAAKADDSVVMLDWVPNSEFIVRLARTVERVMIFDNKEESTDVVKQLSEDNMSNVAVHFNPETTAAMQIYELIGKKLGEFVCSVPFGMVEKIDQYYGSDQRLPSVQSWFCGMDALKIDTDMNTNWDLFQTLRGLRLDDVMAMGSSLYERNMQRVDGAIRRAMAIKLDSIQLGVPTPVWISMTEISEGDVRFADEIARRLAELSEKQYNQEPIGAVIYRVQSKWMVVLRRTHENTFNLLSIANCYEGGGQPDRCGFALDDPTTINWFPRVT